MFSKPRIAVLRGGPSSEYDFSLQTGAMVLSCLSERFYPLDVFIDREGAWHLQGRQHAPEKILYKIDAAWNALHGAYGEDGTVQNILESHAIPFSGSRRLAAALSQNKALAKKIARRAGVKTPHYRVLRLEEVSSLSTLSHELYRTFPQPSVVKPATGGSSLGVSVVQTASELFDALTSAFGTSPTALIEEYIDGREAVCGVVDGMRGEPYYASLPVEVLLPSGARFLDEEARRDGGVHYHCPGRFSAGEKAELQTLSQTMHRLLGLTDYSSSDFIVHPRRGIFFIETDALPSLGASTSPYLLSLDALGITPGQFVGHVLSSAMARASTHHHVS